MPTPYYRRIASARLQLVYVRPGAFTEEQAAQIEAWRADLAPKIEAEADRLAGFPAMLKGEGDG